MSNNCPMLTDFKKLAIEINSMQNRCILINLLKIFKNLLLYVFQREVNNKAED